MLYFFIFIISFFVLAYASSWLVDSLDKLARFLKWKEFVVAFFTMALAATLSNFSVGISSALHGISELSLSEIMGGNIINLTLTVALVVLISKGGLILSSRTVQGSAYFVLLITVLPLLLIADMELSRNDGLILILAFVVYVFWLFSKDDRFTQHYSDNGPIGGKEVFKSLFRLIISGALLIGAAEGIVRSIGEFSEFFGAPISLLGILVVSLGNALPEMFFAIQAARKKNNWMVIGTLMGAIIFPATLVLGTVALIRPIEISDFSPFFIGRFFLFISALVFLIFIKTERTITRKEAIFLLTLYLLFIFIELLIH